MTNFEIKFTHPLLLLLLIPALALVMYTYFRSPKKYRRNRNRIIPVVLYIICMVLGISALSGMHFTYDEANENNELLILVDSSYSGRKEDSEKNAFVRSIINNSDSSVRVGVVTFGFDQVYAAKFSTNKNKVYQQYVNSADPDETATDIASALNYAKTLLEHPKTSKIVLITDGVETDRSALNVIKAIAADGIKVDVAYFPADLSGNEVQIVDVVMPDTRIEAGEAVELGITLQSSYIGNLDVTLYDNEVLSSTQSIQIANGERTFPILHTFEQKGMHTLRFEIQGDNDMIKENNIYYSYVYLEDFNRILILERTAGESEELQEMLNSRVFEAGELPYEITPMAISDIENIPSTLRELRYYDQVILVNISNADLPIWVDGEKITRFDEILEEYVSDYGGGLLTIGGNKDEETTDENNPVANTYVRDDMYDTLYQEMLPVEAIEYTPPAGVMVIIDISGSMDAVDGVTGKTFKQLAQDGARAAVNALTMRDYCGIVSLEDSYKEEMKPLPLPKKAEILAAIDNVSERPGGGTVYQGAIEQAGAALDKLDVERRHIILVSDAAPSDSFEEYGKAIEANFDKGITMSVVVVGAQPTDDMRKAAKAGGGQCYSGTASVPTMMRTDLEMPLIKGVTYEPFIPQIGTVTSVLQGVTQEQLNEEVTLEGFYGTKLKSGAVQSLKSAYVPIYAQWDYGQGKVGSFMCKLSSDGWGKAFVASNVGRTFMNNVITELFPTKNIHAQDIEVSLNEDNYTNQISIYPTLYTEGDKFEVTITTPSTTQGGEDVVQTLTADEGSSGRKFSFIVKEAGTHKIVIKQLAKDGNPVSGIADCVIYKTFSYSEEYNTFYEPLTFEQIMMQVAAYGNGRVVIEASEVFRDFDKYLHRSIDPTLPFIIITLVLFLLNVAVRKFKFKWPHELIRDHKAKKLLEEKNK